MEKRKLASVQYVHDITPIEGADKKEWKPLRRSPLI